MPLFLVMSCEAPTTTDGGTYSCNGQSTPWGGICTLDCEKSDGYTGDATMTCNVDESDESVTWNVIHTCRSK